MFCCLCCSAIHGLWLFCPNFALCLVACLLVLVSTACACSGQILPYAFLLVCSFCYPRLVLVLPKFCLMPFCLSARSAIHGLCLFCPNFVFCFIAILLLLISPCVGPGVRHPRDLTFLQSQSVFCKFHCLISVSRCGFLFRLPIRTLVLRYSLNYLNERY